MAKFCGNCGKEILQNNNFCTNCGKPRVVSVYETSLENFENARYAEALPGIRYAAEEGHGGA